MKKKKGSQCENVLTADNADYASIVEQVRISDSQAELERRMELLHKQDEAEHLADVPEAELVFIARFAKKETLTQRISL